MFKNYFNIAIRSLLKNKLYTLINITGLSVGIAVSVLILIFVAHEFSFDRFHKDGDRIYRVEKTFSRDGRHSLYANPQFGPTMKEIDPHVLNYVRLFEPGRKVVKSDVDHRYFEDRFVFADTSYFRIFSFELVRGERRSLARPNTVIITETTASKYFGDDDAMGRVISYDKDYTFEIVGIAKDPPSNSSLQFDFIGSFSSLLLMPAERDMILNNSSGFPTYLLLSDVGDLPSVKQSILKTTYTNASLEYSLAPFFENHFNLNFGDTSNTRYVFIFLCVALIILALALINYMNLTTARATTRAKEVGIRKVIGANQKTLSIQFYLESAITTAISFILALAIIELFKPAFLDVLQQRVDTSFLRSPAFIGLIAALLLICVFLSGSYPALVLTRFKPVEVLQGKFSNSGQGGWIRKILTIFQFAVSIGLIISTLVVHSQLSYLRSRKIGFDRAQVMAVTIDPLAANSYRAIKAEVRQLPGVIGVATASVPLFKAPMSGVSLVQSPISNEKVGAKWIFADKDFLEVLDVSWEEKPAVDMLTGDHLINETAVQAFGLEDKRTGFEFNIGDSHTGVMVGKIAGIVKDFNYQTLRSKIEPLILTIMSDTVSYIPDDGTLYIRLGPSSGLDEKISSIKKIYEKYSGETPFTYYFLDDAFHELQKGEERLEKIFGIFTASALCIACLGLLGLVTFTAERRTKEISIRKVLGASLYNILSLLSVDLIVLVLIGISIGSPIAWYLMRDWLSNFFYQANIPLVFIFISGVAVMILALVIVCIHGIRAALDNPTKNLRNE